MHKSSKMSGARLLCLALSLTVCAGASVIPDQAWGYVSVRPEAHMFWWLYGCSNASVVRDQQPLVVWLQVLLTLSPASPLSQLRLTSLPFPQGGPGASSTGFGNFLEIGPLNLELKPRNTTWVHASVRLHPPSLSQPRTHISTRISLTPS